MEKHGAIHRQNRAVRYTTEVSSRSPLRILMRQPALPQYRLPIFQQLASRSGVELRLLYATNDAIPNIDPDGLDARSSPLAVRRLPGLGECYRDPELKQEAAAFRPHVVLSWWNVRQVDLFSLARWSSRRGIGTVLWGHGYSKREAGWRRYLRDRLAHSADAVVTYNRRAASAIVGRGVADTKVFVAPNALDQSPNAAAAKYWREHPQELAAERLRLGIGPGPVIGFVSRFDPLNRLDLLIEALPEVRQRVPGAQVVLVGRGDQERPQLEAQARALGVADGVVFQPPEYDPVRVGAYFSLFDVFCYPSNIGLSLLHAFGFGVPVVTSDDLDAQNPEIESLEDGVNGRLYSAGDVGALAGRLVEVLTADAQERKAMRQAAWETAHVAYTPEKMADGLEAACRFAAANASA